MVAKIERKPYVLVKSISTMIKKLFAQQFRKPKGLLGHYSARFMEKNNFDYYSQVVDLLEIKDRDNILEIGCGAGQAINIIARQNSACRIDAIDFSSLMLKKARKNNKYDIQQNRVKLLYGDFERIRFLRLFIHQNICD